ncbi:hypothetical protein COY27_04475 [Candidatus Woesearchaeota archaeon CG_4_10_14_0_2_um_filter_33_13]|nr:MAG: hypothetical protein COY27_04475 [Candidatus Woesearchaeota archaeon CG_4_10_14_0_2_um_filter_33_13]
MSLTTVRNFSKKGQISIEYMAIVGIVTFVVLALFAISQYYVGGIKTTIVSNQADQIAKLIVENAEIVYYHGEPSKITLNVQMPKGVKEINIYENEISFTLIRGNGDIDIFYPSSVPLQGNISTTQGARSITIEALGGYVWVNGT